MTVVIPESCTNWKIAMSCPDIPGITDDPERFAVLQKMLHVVGDAIGWLAHMPSEDVRRNVLQAFASIMGRAQHDMNGAIDEMVELSIWNLPLTNEEELFGVPLRSSLAGCLKTEEETRIAYQAYPEPTDDDNIFDEEEELDGSSDVL